MNGGLDRLFGRAGERDSGRMGLGCGDGGLARPRAKGGELWGHGKEGRET